VAKAGMKRPDLEDLHGAAASGKTHGGKNDVRPVPEISGKAKRGHEKARPL